MLSKASFGVMTMGLALSIAPAALASYTYEGSDYSYDSSSKSKITTCDKESDSNKVHADYKLSNGGQDQVTDTDGNNGQCASEAGWTSPSITSHRTCEERVAAPDPCSSWKAAG